MTFFQFQLLILKKWLQAFKKQKEISQELPNLENSVLEKMRCTKQNKATDSIFCIQKGKNRISNI